MKLFFVCAAVLIVGLIHAQQIPSYKEYWFDQTLDHFNSETYPLTWKQRYLINDDTWDGKGPIFFYTGNEGDIVSFWNNTGLPFEWAADFKALIIFAEHRYYGESWPFGTPEKSLFGTNIGYLSVEQALADYAVLLRYLKVKLNAQNSKIVTFGGSYGGMLAAWMRIKYPYLIAAALAGSAPIPVSTGGPNFNGRPTFFETVTNDYAQADPRCPGIVRSAFSELLYYANQGAAGLNYISSQFSLCSPLTADRVEHLILWAANSFGSLAMVDYPYPASFLAPLPGYPVKVSCNSLLSTSGSLLSRLANAVGLFYNGTGGTLSCYDIESEFVFCSDQTGCGTGPEGVSWAYQACAEIIYFPNTNNVTDMFPPRQWTLDDLKAYCMKTFNIVPRDSWLSDYFGGSDLTGASRIVFSNGLLDPWHGGGFLKNVSDSLIAVVIPGGAHHLDLRWSNPLDPPAVTQARIIEQNYIKTWLSS